MYISLTNGGAYASRYLYGGTMGFNDENPKMYPPDPAPVLDPQLPNVYSSHLLYRVISNIVSDFLYVSNRWNSKYNHSLYRDENCINIRIYYMS